MTKYKKTIQMHWQQTADKYILKVDLTSAKCSDGEVTISIDKHDFRNIRKWYDSYSTVKSIIGTKLQVSKWNEKYQLYSNSYNLTINNISQFTYNFKIANETNKYQVKFAIKPVE